MDEYLDDAWQNAQPPFHGETIHHASLLTLPQLRSALTRIVDRLEHRYGRGLKLLMLDDWHEHDGFRKEGAPIELSALRAVLSDDRRLLNTRHGDFDVCRAVYPVSGEWLVRWYINDDDPVQCALTLSAGHDESREVANALRPIVEVGVQGSAEYFRVRYAG